MKELNPEKIFVQYRDIINPDYPIIDRKYTITHSDTTGDLFVFVSEDFAEDQVTEMRDEVKISWSVSKEIIALTGSVIVDGTDIKGNADIRNKIFYNEMPTALQALRKGDRFLFNKYPNLDMTQVFICFISDKPEYNKIYDFGVIGTYK